MRILIYGLNFSPELVGIGKYTGEMAQWLAISNHDVRVITSPPYYPEWHIGSGYSRLRYLHEKVGYVTVLRSPLWVPKKPKTITRLLHLASFAISSFPQLLGQIAWRPDVIICIAPSFFCTPATILFSKFTNTRSWLHIQDFEIDAMFGLGMMAKGGTLARVALRIESFFLQRFNRVSSISPRMCASLKTKGVPDQSVFHFPNWVDTDFITPQVDRKNLRHKWGFSPSDKIALYSGNIGKKQGLEIILDAANTLREIPDLHFLIVGDGAHKASLVAAAYEGSLQNIHFYPLQPLQSLPDLLSMVDVHLVIQKRGAADAVMPSKLTGIFSAGGDSIITADIDTDLGRLVQNNPGIGKLIEPENSSALSAAIVEFFANGQGGVGGYNYVARQYAVENLGKESVLGRFELALNEVVNLG